MSSTAFKTPQRCSWGCSSMNGAMRSLHTPSRPASCTMHATTRQHIARRRLGDAALATQRRPHWLQQPRAGAMDVMPEWTLDQIAGLAFGGIMIAALLGSQYVDVWVARQQRRQLGLCEECGGLYEPASCQQGKCPQRGQGRQQQGPSS